MIENTTIMTNVLDLYATDLRFACDIYAKLFENHSMSAKDIERTESIDGRGEDKRQTLQNYISPKTDWGHQKRHE
jgi:hypothetical protein